MILSFSLLEIIALVVSAAELIVCPSGVKLILAQDLFEDIYGNLILNYSDSIQNSEHL